PGESTVIEIYPAGTLRRLETVDEQYKDSAHDARGRRDAILTRLESDTVGGIAVTMDEAVRETALSESGGDALDSIIAALAAARAADRGFEPDHGYDEREGCIFV
ncbi:MAG: hypothetical protein ACI8UR_002473, partial [Natronomonas sp.]